MRKFFLKRYIVFPPSQYVEPIDDGPESNNTSSTSSKAPSTSRATKSRKRKETLVDSFTNELETYSQWNKRQKKNKYKFQRSLLLRQSEKFFI